MLHILYGIQIWSCRNLNGLAVKQKSAIRIINGENYNAHTAPRFKKSAILPIAMLVEFFKLQFMHNFLNNFLWNYVAEKWTEDKKMILY